MVTAWCAPSVNAASTIVWRACCASPPGFMVRGRRLLRKPLLDDPTEPLHRLGAADRRAFEGIRRRGAPDDEPWRSLHARRRAVRETALDLGRLPPWRDTLLARRPCHADW